MNNERKRRGRKLYGLILGTISAFSWRTREVIRKLSGLPVSDLSCYNPTPVLATKDCKYIETSVSNYDT
jgi:hypothetical protein